MKTKTLPFLCVSLLLPSLLGATTHRQQQCENKEVAVWKTTIEPQQPLAMHRHDHERIVVALTDVNLTVTNDQGRSHQFIMKKGTARFLSPDQPHELHCDINKTKHPMEVMVIEWKK